jgi:hypothetical protein
MSVGAGGEQLLQMGLDAVLGEAGIRAQIVAVVRMDLRNGNAQRLAFAVGDQPLVRRGPQLAGRRHPVEGIACNNPPYR